MEEEKERGNFKEAFRILVADLCIFKVAFKRLGGNIVYLVRCINWGGLTAIMHPKYLKWFAAVLAVFVAILFLCKGCSSDKANDGSCNSVTDVVEGADDEQFTLRVEPPAVAHKISNISYRKLFNDLNDTHLAVAKKIGVQPLQSRDDIANALRDLVDISDNNAYKVDSLTHSVPFLIPEAAALLQKIGENFQDSLAMKHLPPHKVIVTSVLRTQSDVKKLRKRNTNSSENSVHCYGTTVDISYKRFLAVDGETTENQAKLKLVLGEVLRDLKKEGCCYVKHEKKQACFHITVRKAPK